MKITVTRSTDDKFTVATLKTDDETGEIGVSSFSSTITLFEQKAIIQISDAIVDCGLLQASMTTHDYDTDQDTLFLFEVS